MNACTKQRLIVCDDQEYFIELAPAAVDSRQAAGVLCRRSFVTLTTPSGYACVGSFGRDADDSWSAKITAFYDPASDVNFELVGQGLKRTGAIVALWRNRHRAYLAHTAL